MQLLLKLLLKYIYRLIEIHKITCNQIQKRTNVHFLSKINRYNSVKIYYYVKLLKMN